MRVGRVVAANGGLSIRRRRHNEPIVRPGKVIGIGLNYLDHIEESQLPRPKAPLLFAKFPSSIIGDGEPILVDETLTASVDWEVELAAVIGRTAQAVDLDDALDYVFGFTVANDVSARDLQFADGQWTRGKNLNSFCPLGPVIVTADELGDPQNLELWTKVNGEFVQRSTTAAMIFSVRELIAYCSRYLTLYPGDVIITGTPAGCGEFSTPKRYLRAGDVVETGIAGIGSLTNPVIAVDGTRAR